MNKVIKFNYGKPLKKPLMTPFKEQNRLEEIINSIKNAPRR